MMSWQKRSTVTTLYLRIDGTQSIKISNIKSDMIDGFKDNNIKFTLEELVFAGV